MGAPLSPVGRVAFESAYEPTAMEEGQTKKYKVTLIWPKKMTDAKQKQLFMALYNKAQALSKEKFGVKLGEKYKGKEVKSPFRDGAEKEHLSGFGEDVIFAAFSSKLKPNVVDRNREPLDVGDGFYNGCYAHVTYSVFHYTKGANPGIGLGLFNIQKIKDGEPFGAGQSDVNSDFDDLSEDSMDDIDGLLSGVAAGDSPDEADLPF